MIGMEEKTLLRGRMKAARGEFSQSGAAAAADAAIAANLFSLPQVAAGKSFFVYRSFGSEADTRRIAERLMQEGKILCYPRVCGAAMVPVQYTGQPFLRGAFGVEEPCGEPYTGVIDVCVVPLLAADRHFCRLGYGGGFYDRYFAGGGKGAFKAGVCYDFQLIKTVPVKEHDVRLDAVVTERRVLLRDRAED